MNKIVVTGATSMIGVALIEEAIKNKIKVLAIVRENSSRLDRLPKSDFVRVVPCDIEELDKIPMVEEEYDVFYHFAWNYTDGRRRQKANLQVRNIDTTLKAVELAKRLGCKKFIGAGSQAEYGVKENKIGPNTEINPSTAYGVAKYSACKLSKILCEELNIEHIWARIFSVYGKYDNDGTLIRYTIDSLIKGEKPSFTKMEQRWDYLYEKDAGRAFYLMGLYGKNNSIYCVGSGEAVKLSQYINIIHKALNSDVPLGIGEKEYSRNQVMYLCADITSLTEDTGFKPQYKFEDAINETIQYYLEKHNNKVL